MEKEGINQKLYISYMKPKLFIGSSKESLSVAYAIQNNLQNDVETTVWTQGVFTLSTTIIESLIMALESSDFGIFLLSPDDLLKIKKRSVTKARDNVIFELGLFWGKLGRGRSFIIIPQDSKLSLPTDLSGIVYGTYDSNRSDGNLEAALGPTCNQIRIEISKLGLINKEGVASNNEQNTHENIIEPDSNIDSKGIEWFDAYFLEKDYNLTISLLEAKKAKMDDNDDKYEADLFIVLSKNKLNPQNDSKNFSELIEKYKSDIRVYKTYLNRQYNEDNYSNVLKLSDEYLEIFPNNEELLLIKINALLQLGLYDESFNHLKNHIKIAPISEDVMLKFITVSENTPDKRKLTELLHYAFIKFPNSENIISKYYTYFDEVGEYEKGLFLIDRLNNNKPSANYTCLKGNMLLNLKFNNAAMDCYMKAIDLSERKESWILANVGNLFRNQSFYSEAIKYLEEAKKLSETSDYTLDRLSHSIKEKKEENEKVETLIKKSKQVIFQLEYDENLLENL